MSINPDQLSGIEKEKLRSPDYINCPNCNKENPENLARCTKCGEPLQ